jgi:hypothetical protein
LAFPFAHPEAAKLFEELLPGLVNESDRGAVLIGAAYADNVLRSLLETVAPSALSPKDRKALFNGALRSFSTKIEVAFVARLIPKNIHNGLRALRKLRNEVAHSPASFELKGQHERYWGIYPLGPDVPAGIQRLAFEMMFNYKATVVLEAVQKNAAELEEIEDLDYTSPIQTKADVLTYLSEHPDVMEVLEGQLPKWELAIGIATLCALIILHRDRAVKILGSDSTIDQLKIEIADPDASKS